MAYYSGTATSLANLLSNFLTNAQADGWTLTGSVLSKAGVFFQLTSDANNVKCLGCESNAVANPAPSVVMIGRVYFLTGHTTRLISFPCNYEVFGFGQEIYLVVNYDVDTYQWLAFGKSSVPGLPGQGGWCGATIGGAASTYAGPGGGLDGFIKLLLYSATTIATPDGGAAVLATPAVLFASHQSMSNSPYPSLNSFVNSGLDSEGWYAGQSLGHIGLDAISELLWQQPSVWNSEAALLPIRAWKRRASYKVSLAADLAYARHLRIDNLAPGDLLTIGSDKWKVFPWYKKNAAARNGGDAIQHTGTFGWAIKYEGP